MFCNIRPYFLAASYNQVTYYIFRYSYKYISYNGKHCQVTRYQMVVLVLLSKVKRLTKFVSIITSDMVCQICFVTSDHISWLHPRHRRLATPIHMFIKTSCIAKHIVSYLGLYYAILVLPQERHFGIIFCV